MQAQAPYVYRPHRSEKPRSTLVRSLIKTVAYRAISTVYTVALAWFIFGDVALAASFGAADVVLNSLLYFGHERLWAWIDLRQRING